MWVAQIWSHSSAGLDAPEVLQEQVRMSVSWQKGLNMAVCACLSVWEAFTVCLPHKLHAENDLDIHIMQFRD